MHKTMTSLCTIALIGGCGQSSAPAPQRTIKVQGDEQRQLASANEMDRSIALKRAIYDAGNSCKRVTKTGFVTDYKNLSMWQAACDDGKNWAVFIAANGGVQVRPCADLKDLKLPECTLAATKADTRTAGTRPAA
ncbi:MAG: hypothetical protein ABR588_08645 [Sphingomicrobium sp.]|nr:hypothetical protein [Sphingomonadales bacterium]